MNFYYMFIIQGNIMGFFDLFKEKTNNLVTINKNSSSNSMIINNGFNGHISKEIFDLLWFADGPYKNYVNKDSFQEINAGNIKIKISFSSSEEPSLIYTTYPVIKPINTNEIAKPNYFPSYKGLNPNQRWIYLNWLTNPLKKIDIGYVFIFYYGLERHLLAEKFDEAFDMIMSLRKVHKNNSLQSYSANALILASMYRNRPDRLQEFLEFLDPQEINSSLPLYLLSKYLFNKKLNTDEIIYLAKSVGFTNNRYIKNEPELFKKILTIVLIELYSEPYLSIKNFNLNDLPSSTVPLTANYSVPSEKRFVHIPNLSENKEFREIIFSLLNGTHEAVKKSLREARKKNSTKIN